MLDAELLVKVFIQHPIPCILIKSNTPLFDVVSVNEAFRELSSCLIKKGDKIGLLGLLESCILEQHPNQFLELLNLLDAARFSETTMRLDVEKIIFTQSQVGMELEFYTQIEITPIRDNQNLELFLISFLPAIEKYKQENHLSYIEKLALEKALKHSDAHLNNIIEGIGAGTWEWDIASGEVKRSGEIFEIILGKNFKNENLPNGHWKSLIFEEDLQRVLDSNKVTLENPEAYFWEEEFRIKICEGHYIWIRERGYIFRDDCGNAVHAIGATQNINEQKNYIKAIEEQNCKLREIAWMQSHVVRAPLARMMGIVELLKTSSLTQEEFLEFMPHFMNSAEELDSIIKDISSKTKNI